MLAQVPLHGLISEPFVDLAAASGLEAPVAKRAPVAKGFLLVYVL